MIKWRSVLRHSCVVERHKTQYTDVRTLKKERRVGDRASEVERGGADAWAWSEGRGRYRRTGSGVAGPSGQARAQG